MQSARDPSLLIVSPLHSAALAAVCVTYGWRPDVVAPAASPVTAFAGDPSRVVLVDARDGSGTAIDTVRDLAPIVELRRGALLVLLPEGETLAATAVEAGATHILTAPFGDARLAASIHLAIRARDRLDVACSRYAADYPAMSNDRLTGLATAVQAHAWLELLIAAPDAPPTAAVILELAIGRFGQLNAAYGHAVADAVLREIAVRLRRIGSTMTFDGKIVSDLAEHAAATRCVARLAGAEFAMVFAPPATVADVAKFASHIAAGFETPVVIDGHTIHLGCRCGIAVAHPAAGELAIVEAGLGFQRASIALELARSRDPGHVEVFRIGTGEGPIRRMAELESDLHTAIGAGEVEIVFQPQVEIVTGRIVGVEALVRWRHPALGELTAETLLKVAESAEFATRLGTYIQQQALRVAADWPAVLDGLRLAVNVTARDLAGSAFIAGLDAALATSGFPPGRLTLEITESDLIENLATAAAVLARVRARGIAIALDDFGTGYSSLAYLKALPLDCLKVDKRLVGDLAGSVRDRVVVKGVVDMARALGIRVVAEGIETEDQRMWAAAAGCDWYQGFLCAAPMPGAKLPDFVAAWNLRLPSG